MKLLKSLVLLTFLTSSAPLLAEDVNFRTETEESRSLIGLGVEQSQLRANSGVIKGTGAKLDFSHYLNSKYNLQVYLMSGLASTNAGSVAANFTGFGGYFYYTVSGNCCRFQKRVLIQGVPAIIEKIPRTNTWNVGAGLDQYMIYGTSSIYPASGLGLATNYQFALLSLQWRASLKASLLSAGSVRIQNTSFGLSLLFEL